MELIHLRSPTKTINQENMELIHLRSPTSNILTSFLIVATLMWSK